MNSVVDLRRVRFVHTEDDGFDQDQISDREVGIIWVKDLGEMRRKFSASVFDSNSAASLCLRDSASNLSFKVQFSGSEDLHRVSLSDLLMVDRGLSKSFRLTLAAELAQAVLTYHETGLIAESLGQNSIWFATTDPNVLLLDDLVLPLDLASALLRSPEQTVDTVRDRSYCGGEFNRVSMMLGVTLAEVLLLKKALHQNSSTMAKTSKNSDTALSEVLNEWGQGCYDAVRTCQAGALGHRPGSAQHQEFLKGVLLPLRAALGHLYPAETEQKKNHVLGQIPDKIRHPLSEKVFPEKITDETMKASGFQNHAALQSVKEYVQLIMQGCASISWLDDKFSAESMPRWNRLVVESFANPRSS